MKAYPIRSCYGCPARQTAPIFDEYGDQIGLVPICVYDWYDDKGPKKEINTLGRASFPEWCPLEDVE
jgi:hypothetical protein